jgi:integrase
MELVAPKTAHSRRTLPLPAMVADVLAAHLSARPAGPGGLLWHTSTGRPINRDYYGGVFAKAVTAAGLPPGTTSHDLRHHFATELLNAGLSVMDVAKLLGHKDATLVVRTYGHPSASVEDRARRALDGAWSADPIVSGETGTAQGRPK